MEQKLVFQLLRSNSLPDLDKFRHSSFGPGQEIPSPNDWRNEFRGFKPIVDETRITIRHGQTTTDEITMKIPLGHSICKFLVTKFQTDFLYKPLVYKELGHRFNLATQLR